MVENEMMKRKNVKGDWKEDKNKKLWKRLVPIGMEWMSQSILNEHHCNLCILIESDSEIIHQRNETKTISMELIIGH
jgi:hypothetical protein